jgi:hypothetical protein
MANKDRGATKTQKKTASTNLKEKRQAKKAKKAAAATKSQSE